MVIRGIRRALREDHLLDGAVRLMRVALDDLVEQERAVAEGGQVLAAHHVQQAVRVAQVIHAVDDLPKQRLPALDGVLERGREHIPSAVAVLTIALVLVNRQAHGDVVQDGVRAPRHVLRVKVLRVLRVHHRAARQHRRREHDGRHSPAQPFPAQHHGDQAGDGRNHHRKADLRAEGGQQRERDHPQQRAVPRKADRPSVLPAARLHDAHGAVDDHGREGEREAVRINLGGAVQQREAQRRKNQKAHLRHMPADPPQNARARQQPRGKEQAVHQHQLHEPVLPAQTPEEAEDGREHIDKPQVVRAAGEVVPRALAIPERAGIHHKLRRRYALLRIGDRHKAQRMPHRQLDDQVKQHSQREDFLFVPGAKRLRTPDPPKQRKQQAHAHRRQQKERRAAAVIQRPRRKKHIARREQVAGNHQPHAGQQQDVPFTHRHPP